MVEVSRIFTDNKGPTVVLVKAKIVSREDIVTITGNPVLISINFINHNRPYA